MNPGIRKPRDRSSTLFAREVADAAPKFKSSLMRLPEGHQESPRMGNRQVRRSSGLGGLPTRPETPGTPGLRGNGFTKFVSANRLDDSEKRI